MMSVKTKCSVCDEYYVKHGSVCGFCCMRETDTDVLVAALDSLKHQDEVDIYTARIAYEKLLEELEWRDENFDDSESSLDEWIDY